MSQIDSLANSSCSRQVRTMASKRTISDSVRKIALAAVEVVADMIPFVAMLLSVGPNLVFIAGIGIVAILGKVLILASIPFILRHLVFFLDLVNLCIEFANAFFNVDIAIIDAIIAVADEIVSIINSVSKLFSGRKAVANLGVNFVRFFTLKTVSKRSFRDFLVDIETSCSKTDIQGGIASITDSVLHVCDIGHYLQPALGDNMFAPFCNTYSPQPVCIVLDTGYIVLDVFLPIAMAGICIAAFGSSLASMAAAILAETALMVEWLCLVPVKWLRL